ncbi:MAG: VIT1/CCC1 transporter family protein [Nanoarchaeota archaeon]|nr:VIT1/CCC1 transporter family protein [Nanoarchaeota archaeon]
MNLHKEAHSSLRSRTYLREIVFGVEDGLISTLGIVAGVSGAAAGNMVVLLAGLAGMFSGAVSMAAGTYLSTKSERELYKREAAREAWEIDHQPAIERKEIRDIYRARGFKGKQLDQMVKLVTSNKQVWINAMMEGELNMSKPTECSWKAAAAIALAFVPGGLVTLAPFLVFEGVTALLVAFVLTMGGLLVFGSMKSRLAKTNVVVGALEMMVVGMLAAGAGYSIGLLFGVL